MLNLSLDDGRERARAIVDDGDDNVFNFVDVRLSDLMLL
jgi:hypothetical protein